MNYDKIFEKKKILLYIVGLLISIGLTFAFFIPHITQGIEGFISEESGTVDELIFHMSSDNTISLEPGQHTMKPETGNSIFDEMVAKVSLMANNNTKRALKKYSVGMNIKMNSFVYSSGDEKQIPELLLKVTKNGKEIKNINSLTYKVVDDAVGGPQSGFDITKSVGYIHIGDDFSIFDDFNNIKPTIDEWKFKIICVNLPFDQFINDSSEFNAEFVLQVNSKVIANVSNNNDDSVKVDIIESNKKNNNISKYMYKINDGNWVEKNCNDQGSTSHTFTGLHGIYPRKIYVTSVDKYGAESKINYFYIGDSSNAVIEYFKNQNSNTNYDIEVDGSYESGIYHHNGSIKNYDNLQIDSNDTSYRYTGKNVNNYIKFSGDNDNNRLFRIIGAFKNETNDYQLKLLTSEPLLEKRKWNDVNNKDSNEFINRWEWIENGVTKKSQLNEYLNTEYLNTFPIEIKNKISMHKWIVGGNEVRTLVHNTPLNSYNKEILNPEVNDISNSKIGLMYINDYAYATLPSYWSQKIRFINESGILDNWLYPNGEYEWLITRDSRIKNYAFGLYKGGYVDSWTYSQIDQPRPFRPTFYVNSSVKIVGGNGSKEYPYILD